LSKEFSSKISVLSSSSYLISSFFFNLRVFFSGKFMSTNITFGFWVTSLFPNSYHTALHEETFLHLRYASTSSFCKFILGYLRNSSRIGCSFDIYLTIYCAMSVAVRRVTDTLLLQSSVIEYYKVRHWHLLHKVSCIATCSILFHLKLEK